MNEQYHVEPVHKRRHIPKGCGLMVMIIALEAVMIGTGVVLIARDRLSNLRTEQLCLTGWRLSLETISNRGLTVLQAQRASFLPGRNRTPYLAADLIKRGMDDGAELQAVAPGLKWSPTSSS